MPLALLAVATIFLSRPELESDLTSRAEDLLIDVGEQWARARFDGRDARLEGEALSEAARVKVRGELDRLFGVRTVDDRTTLLPERRPFTFSAIRDGSKLRLDGYVPSRFVRSRIIEAARGMAPGITVSGENELVRARGVPAGDFAGIVAFGFRQLARLPAGRFTLSDDAFSIEGRAPDFATYDALEVTVRSELPSDFKLARFSVLPPIAAPFAWSAQREDDGVRLSGYIPLGDTRRALLDVVRGAIPGAAISDQLRLADGSPPAEGWLKAVSYALTQLARLPGAKVTLTDTTIAIEGKAPDFTAYDALAAARRSVPEGYTLTRFAVEAPSVSPFVWGISHSAAGLRLTGYAPSEDAKRLLVDALRASFPGVQPMDEMRIASGGPVAESWVAAATFGAAQIARLRAGEVRGEAMTLSIAGEALDSAAYNAVSAALGHPLPGGFKLQHGDVRPPVVAPYVFGLRKDTQGLTVSGFYPFKPDHEALLVQAKAQLLGAPVNDVSAVALGAPTGFNLAATVALRELARLEAGEARIDDQHLRFSGTALYPAAVDSIRRALASDMPPGFTTEVTLDVAAPPPPADNTSCQKALADIASRGRLDFIDGGASIAPTSHGLLDHLVAAASACPDAVIEIAAPAGAADNPMSKQAISDERARAVAAYLAAAGIAQARLVISGHELRADNGNLEFLVR
ncbi:OmpA family protein [Ancylobacter terrae]|uniref:OmpA family protein n=1 Tax=Ancylobacter sp. sgz301288 TaxID=3342077 RepID=UPI00385C32A3